MKKRIVAALLAFTMVATTLAGCTTNTSPDSDQSTKVEKSKHGQSDDGSDDIDTQAILDNLSGDSIAGTLSAFAGGTDDSDFTYTNPMYGVAIDHVFEFESVDSVGWYNANNTFGVYRTLEDVEQAKEGLATQGQPTGGHPISLTTYEDGILSVTPFVSVSLDGAYTDEDLGLDSKGSWGVNNRLYLVQWMDLETGEYFDEPIVTIFSVDHGIDAPVVSQGLDDENLYTLSWEPVDGATEYSIFRCFNDYGFIYEGTTTDTDMCIDEFAGEQEMLSMLSSFTVDYTNAVFGMNYQIESAVRKGDRYVVIAKGNGTLSGISNYVDPAAIASAVPNSSAGDAFTFKLNSIDDIPLYADVTMADGSVRKMLIEYSGGAIYETDDGNVYIAAKFYNTNLHCGLRLEGITVDDVSNNKDLIKEKVAKEAAVTGGAINNDLTTSLVPTSDEEEKNDDVEEIISETIGDNTNNTDDPDGDITDPDGTAPDVDTPDIDDPDTDTPDTDTPDIDDPDTDTPDVDTPDVDTPDVDTPDIDTPEPDNGNHTGPEPTVTPSGYTTTELYNETLKLIDAAYKSHNINTDDLSKIIYANNELEAYLAFALTARMEVIPVPTELYPESVNLEYLFGQFVEAYRQNPTSGFITGYNYVFDYECIRVAYAEDTDSRLNKTKEEMDAAKSIASAVVSSSMTEAEKVYAINDYFCENASYDFDSTSTSVTADTITDSFLDAHNPYGILCNNYGVCESYSEAFALTARFAGINAIMETGYLNGGAHEWNKVMLDGQYYIVDVTNNDQDDIKNSLLLISSDTAVVLSADTYSFTFKAPATDDSKDYLAYVGKVASSDDEAKKIIEDQLDAGDFGFVRMNYVATDDDVVRILTAVHEDGYYFNGGQWNNVIVAIEGN